MAGDVISPQGPIFRSQNQEQQDFYVGWSSSYATDLKRENEIKELRKIVTKLSEEVNRLESIITGMGVAMGGSSIRFSVVDMNDRSLSETKNLLISYYQAHRDQAIYPDDVASELGLDLKLTMQAVRELIQEEKIGEVT